LGKVREVTKFYKTFGIDIVNKKVEQHLCQFVRPGKMHRLFTQHLRPDGMGVDYSKIDYEFEDPLK